MVGSEGLVVFRQPGKPRTTASVKQATKSHRGTWRSRRIYRPQNTARDSWFSGSSQRQLDVASQEIPETLKPLRRAALGWYTSLFWVAASIVVSPVALGCAVERRFLCSVIPEGMSYGRTTAAGLFIAVHIRCFYISGAVRCHHSESVPAHSAWASFWASRFPSTPRARWTS